MIRLNILCDEFVKRGLKDWNIIMDTIIHGYIGVSMDIG
jgi:hypothetical protein